MTEGEIPVRRKRETPAERKARRRAYEKQFKPPCRIVSQGACEEFQEYQAKMRNLGRRSKLTCPGKPDMHFLPFVDPDIKAHRCNGYNISLIHGISDLTVFLGLTGSALLTLTCPGRMHSGYRGFPNPLWDGSQPSDQKEYLDSVWKNIRQNWKRKGLEVRVYRAAEAHKDGTLHWHILLFFAPGKYDEVKQVIEETYHAEDRNHERHRIKIEEARSRDGAQSYIGKYVRKNTKGISPGYMQQCVWRNFHGIRAFATSRGLKPGIYNHFRRFPLPGPGSDCPPSLADGVVAARSNRMYEASQFADVMGLRLRYEDRISFRGTHYKAPVGIMSDITGECWDKPRWTIVDMSPEDLEALGPPTPVDQFDLQRLEAAWADTNPDDPDDTC